MSQPPIPVDLIIQADWVLPIEPSGTVYRDHAVAIHDGRIQAILSADELGPYTAAKQLRLPNHVLMPGLVNAHGHAAMSLLRGYADDLPLMRWLEDHIWPAENKHVSAEFVRDGTALSMAEMLLSGTTSFSDMYFFPEVVAALCAQTGMRAQLATPVFDFPTIWGSGADEYISKALALRDDCKNLDRLTVAFGPHAPYSVSVGTLEKIATYAAELDMAVHIHLHETRGEVLSAVEGTGERPIDKLRRIGLLGPRTQCVHMTDLGTQDIANLSETGAQVVHCPQSNMKLASGACPVAALLEAGVNVGLGTDGAASNNALNLFNEMHSAALLGKLTAADPSALPAAKVLHMATLGGARAIGLDHLIGSITPGKQADLIAVDLSSPATQPLYNPQSQLVYACTGGEVTHSWVDGQMLVRERQLTTLDVDDCIARARAWGQKIAASA
jgi:5-methylthioadenosine/S-adenosylhomocysteine deaminase